MQAQTQPFFTAQANLLAEGRLSRMARSYSVPLMVLLTRTGNWHRLASRQAILQTFYSKHLGVKEAGVGRLRACVMSETFTAPDRCRAEVTWFYVDRDARRLGRTVARYFLSRRADGLRVDMIEFRQVAFPQLIDWFGENSKELARGTGPRI